VSMRTFVLVIAFLSAGIAEAAERQVSASNGVVIDINGDEFDGRLEYTAPMVKFDNESSFFLVAAIKANGQQAGPMLVVGNVYYRGEWRQYAAAHLRGGEAVKSTFGDRNVVSCSGSRYSSGCSLREGFQLTLTDAQIAKYAADGYVDMKLKASASNEEPVIRVPLSYIHAVREVSRGTMRAASAANSGVRALQPQPQATAAPPLVGSPQGNAPVRRSGTGICYDQSYDAWEGMVGYTEFPSLDSCIASGGKGRVRVIE